jgi:hypothetical protein
VRVTDLGAVTLVGRYLLLGPLGSDGIVKLAQTLPTAL